MACCKTYTVCAAIHGIHALFVLQYTECMHCLCCNTRNACTVCVAIHGIHALFVLQYTEYLHCLCCSTRNTCTVCVAVHGILALFVLQYTEYMECMWSCMQNTRLPQPSLPLLPPPDQALVFGCPLDKLCAREKSTFPKFIAQCIKEVERRGLNSQGIYRLSGNAAEVTKLRYLVDQGEAWGGGRGVWGT